MYLWSSFDQSNSSHSSGGASGERMFLTFFFLWNVMNFAWNTPRDFTSWLPSSSEYIVNHCEFSMKVHGEIPTMYEIHLLPELYFLKTEVHRDVWKNGPLLAVIKTEKLLITFKSLAGWLDPSLIQGTLVTGRPICQLKSIVEARCPVF